VTPKWLHLLCLGRANVRDPSNKRSGAGLDPDFMARVHHLLETEVLKGRCSAASVAHLFTIDRRTLNRRLNAQGTAYRQVANRVRFDIACRLLADPGMTIAQVAAMLKFSEPSAFTHAFRRWSGGQTPRAWRALHCKGALTSSPPR
jgi:AraC-like DNA-binding protein